MMTRSLHVMTIVGARPQFIKAAPMSRALRSAGHREQLIHTGQHYDAEMSQIFFDELGMAPPDVNLAVGSGRHGQQTAAMLEGLERLLVEQRPDAVVLYGDTNSTIAGALAAAKLHVPVAHVEAGLRSFERKMPEEINRVVTDHLATLRWAPSRVAVENLAREGITEGVEEVGDIMIESLAATRASGAHADLAARHGLTARRYLLATIHRAENTTAEPLARILAALDRIEEPVIVPLHPRTRAAVETLGYRAPAHVRFIDPVGHAAMVALLGSARLVLTDSGGLQKEAYWLGVPCVTLRGQTEWVETVELGWNRLVDTDSSRILDAVRSFAPPASRPALYGDGCTAARCVRSLERALDGKRS